MRSAESKTERAMDSIVFLVECDRGRQAARSFGGEFEAEVAFSDEVPGEVCSLKAVIVWMSDRIWANVASMWSGVK